MSVDFKEIPKIITAVGESPLGLLSLIIILLAAIVIALFTPSSDSTKLLVFFALFISFLFYAFVLSLKRKNTNYKSNTIKTEKLATNSNNIRRIYFIFSSLVSVAIIVLLLIYYFDPFIMLEHNENREKFRVTVYSMSPNKYSALIFRSNGARFEELPILNKEQNKSKIQGYFYTEIILKNITRDNQITVLLVKRENVDKIPSEFPISRFNIMSSYSVRTLTATLIP